MEKIEVNQMETNRSKIMRKEIKFKNKNNTHYTTYNVSPTLSNTIIQHPKH